MDKEQLRKDLEPGINFIESMARAESDKEGRWHRALAALGVLFGETLESEGWPNIDQGGPDSGSETESGAREDDTDGVRRGGYETVDPPGSGTSRCVEDSKKPAAIEEE